MTVRKTKNALGHEVWEVDAPPLTAQQTAELVKKISDRLGSVEDIFKAQHRQQLEGKRQSRLTRESLDSLTPKERKDFEALYGPIALTRQAFEQAIQESDHLWMEAEQQQQFEDLQAWEKEVQHGRASSRDRFKKIEALHEAGAQRAQERLAARQARELEAEDYDSEVLRLYNSLNQDEQAIFTRIIESQPSIVESVEQFKAETRNPIAGIDDPETLYRLASRQMAQPAGREYIPPATETANVDDARTLYKMAARDGQAASDRTKKRRVR